MSCKSLVFTFHRLLETFFNNIFLSFSFSFLFSPFFFLLSCSFSPPLFEDNNLQVCLDQVVESDF